MVKKATISEENGRVTISDQPYKNIQPGLAQRERDKTKITKFIHTKVFKNASHTQNLPVDRSVGLFLR